MSDTSHRRTVVACLGIVAGMAGLSYAAVPLDDPWSRSRSSGRRAFSALCEALA